MVDKEVARVLRLRGERANNYSATKRIYFIVRSPEAQNSSAPDTQHPAVKETHRPPHRHRGGTRSN
jgi:hypothetical protein